MINRITLLLFVGLSFAQEITIAVFDLENNGLKDSEVRTLTERLQGELVKIGGYTVVERKKIEKVIQEQKFQMSGLIDEKYLIDIGKMLGAELIVLGNVGKVGNIYTVSARIVNSETAEILRSTNYDTGTSISNLLTVGMANIAHKLINGSDSAVKKELDNNQKVNSQRNQTENVFIICNYTFLCFLGWFKTQTFKNSKYLRMRYEKLQKYIKSYKQL